LDAGCQGNTEQAKEHLFSIRLKEVVILEEQYRLYSLQNIQEELHKNESDSWQKIIRVMTHEIMNSVAPMLSMTKSMKKNLRTDRDPDLKKFEESLNVIESTGEGLIGFTDNYRRLSQLPPPVKEKLNIEDALRKILLLVEEEAKILGVDISLNCEGQEAFIQADKQQFEMMVVNLLKNSFDALAEREGQRTIHISVVKSGGRTLVRVEDNGTGIEENLAEQVFVPFFSTKEEGSGIGLSLIRQIMNLHGGSVSLETEPGERTAVTLAFSGQK
jgi:signal transduction histidine kinase